MKMLLIYWAVMIAAYFTASRLRAYRERLSFFPHATMGIVYVIVLLMGLRMGTNKQVIGNLASIGLQALVITIFCVGGSMLAVFGLRKFFGMNKFGDIKKYKKRNAALENKEVLKDEELHDTKNNQVDFKSTLTILALVVIGTLIGYIVVLKRFYSHLEAFDEHSSTMMTVCLCLMLAFVGFDLGLSGKVAECFKSIGIRALAFPVAAIAGTLAMGAISGMFFGFSIREGLAISAGFGWYTYAPAIIANAGAEYTVASTVAFMYNVIRETASIVLIPVFAKRFGYLEATAMPGISAMDLCMPIIERSCRQDTIIYAFLTGFFMNIVTSAGVPLIMGL